jgi:hypothetical protein
MSMETNKPESTSTEPLKAKFKFFLKKKVDIVNNAFNNLSITAKRITLMGMGALVAGVCVLLIFQALFSQNNTIIKVDQLNLPKDIYMKQSDTTSLTHIGKMKGEIDKKFESFHLAVDNDGNLFINRDPEFSKDSLNKSKGWEPITRQQLKDYEEQLHFIPDRKKGLKR